MDVRTQKWPVALLLTVIVSAARPASADVTISGDVLPNDPSDPWVVGGVLRVGVFQSDPDTHSGEVLVSNRGTLITEGAAVGGGNGFDVDFYGTVSVIGYGSKWINHGAIKVGARAFNFGTVNVRNGAQVVTDDILVSAGGLYDCGHLLVKGYDTTLTSKGTAIIGSTECANLVEIKQGASFFSNNVRITTCSDCYGKVLATGYATRWVSTGDFIVGAVGGGEVEIGYEAKLSTVNAQIASGDGPSVNYTGRVTVGGWGATWTNQGLLRVGVREGRPDLPGYGTLAVGTYGTVDTEDTEVTSKDGGAVIQVAGFQASWHSRGDVKLRATQPFSPSLVIDDGGLVRIGGTLAIERWLIDTGAWYPAPVARLVNGTLVAGVVEALDGDFAFAGGRLNIGSFRGDLANIHAGILVVGGEHPSTSIVGDYTQGPDAKMNLTVVGPSSTPLLQVEGNLHLDGRLEARAAEGTVPFQAGDTVPLLGWNGSLTGSFASVNIALPLAPGLAWDTSELYTIGVITVVSAN